MKELHSEPCRDEFIFLNTGSDPSTLCSVSSLLNNVGLRTVTNYTQLCEDEALQHNAPLCAG